MDVDILNEIIEGIKCQKTNPDDSIIVYLLGSRSMYDLSREDIGRIMTECKAVNFKECTNKGYNTDFFDIKFARQLEIPDRYVSCRKYDKLSIRIKQA